MSDKCTACSDAEGYCPKHAPASAKTEAAAVGDDEMIDDLAHDVEFHAMCGHTPHDAARRALEFLHPYLRQASPAQGGGIRAILAMRDANKEHLESHHLDYHGAAGKAFEAIGEQAMPTICSFCKGLDGRHYQDCAAIALLKPAREV